MRTLWLPLLAGCPWISSSELEDRYDPDKDGILWPDDCDDRDPEVGLPTDFFRDDDHDGFGDPERSRSGCEATPPEGWAANADDCDDTDPTLPAERWTDADNDGVGDPNAPVFTCVFDGTAQPGAEDCDDTEPDAYPGNPEICNDGIDNDCDNTANDCIFEGDFPPGVAVLTLADTELSGFGTSLVVADLSGDDNVDLVAGAPLRGAYNTGMVMLFEGQLARWPTPLDAPLAATTLLAPETEGAQFGLSLAVSGRGLAIGAPGDNVNGSGAGSLYFYEDPKSGSPTTVLLGAAVGGGFGWDEAAMGDVDGDSQLDLAVSAPFLGETYLLRGPLVEGHLPTSDPRFAPALTLRNAPGVYGVPGFAIAGGDTDSDGVSDLVVGDYGLNSGEGGLTVVSGDETGDQELSSYDQYSLGLGYGLLGWAVGIPGDIDGDGAQDILAGAPTAEIEGTPTGIVWLLSGADREGPIVEGAPGAYGFGVGVDGVGDLDGDGFDDFTIVELSDVNGLGTAHLFYGRADLGSLGGSALDLASARFVGLVLSGYGYPMAGVGGGDLDADGAADLAVGSPESPSSVMIYAGLGL